MSNQQHTNREKQKGQPGSGSKYNEEHAGKVTGYGQADPNAEGLTNISDKTSS
ncbi:hypothetical protein ACIQXV_08535 [Neobacillus sp. NPDC097160]|uniref:hypothetical protein n=1 Tax=Neobacillus sp. NPDC097160 TaxID=3364298 RepID=UPI003815BB9E